MFQLFQLLINKHINSYSRIKNHDPFFELTFFAFSTRSSVIGERRHTRPALKVENFTRKKKKRTRRNTRRSRAFEPKEHANTR